MRPRILYVGLIIITTHFINSLNNTRMKEKMRLLLIACISIVFSVQAFASHQIIFDYKSNGLTMKMKKDTVKIGGVTYRLVLGTYSIEYEYMTNIPVYLHIGSAHFEAIDYDKDMEEILFEDSIICSGDFVDPYSENVSLTVESEEIFYPHTVDFDQSEPHDRLNYKTKTIAVTGFADNVTFAGNSIVRTVKLPEGITSIPIYFFIE